MAYRRKNNRAYGGGSNIEEFHSGAGVPLQYKAEGPTGLNMLNGVFVAKVTRTVDETYQGHIIVELIGHDRLSDKENDEERKKFHRIRRLVPFGGYEHLEDGKYSVEFGINTQPPTVGSMVLVAFTGYDQEGFLLGVLPDTQRNSQIPGLPAQENLKVGGGKLAVTHDGGVKHPDIIQKNPHPLFEQIIKQGLQTDSVRGLGSSGGRRESPSNVFGFSTMGGHSLVLDDGTVANEEGISKSPDPGREPELNKMIRLRSKEGAQLLFNDTWGIVYLIQQEGNAWIQMDKEGNIDIYSDKNISFHAKENLNFYAGKELNLDADSINIKARGEDGMKIETATGTFDVHSNKDIRITTDLNMNLRAKPHMKLTADLIDINGPPADPAEKPEVNNLTLNREVVESVTDRVPEHEPWGGHAEDPHEDKIAVQAGLDLEVALSDYPLPDGLKNPTQEIKLKPEGNVAAGHGKGSKEGIIK